MTCDECGFIYAEEHIQCVRKRPHQPIYLDAVDIGINYGELPEDATMRDYIAYLLEYHMPGLLMGESILFYLEDVGILNDLLVEIDGLGYVYEPPLMITVFAK